jgi:hypothetical protein
MGFVFDHSSPHPGRMGEIYEDEDYIPMSRMYPACYQIPLLKLHTKTNK